MKLSNILFFIGYTSSTLALINSSNKSKVYDMNQIIHTMGVLKMVNGEWYSILSSCVIMKKVIDFCSYYPDYPYCDTYITIIRIVIPNILTVDETSFVIFPLPFNI
ncbi:hypothetical protein BCR32DRAFT_277932 [Anaeromyces robustus]|uniref:Uncharacterized protein n=1 Tax=Anaeromyces robustus TaxID=1754192 RepID=A0A1Y1XCR0_9FUNG|nr:hypothetical protein BCR32DRAFT_277932 [Anaeromyces robustus]|eukprot:ORX83529.1 hypothetical protein BCR32DRAFT_277932 [Anaeromyces robustus]